MKTFNLFKSLFFITTVIGFSITASAANYPFTASSIALTNNTGCSLSNYTFSQTTDNVNGAKITAGATVTIVFPAGVNISTATMAGSTFKGNAISAGWTIVGQTLTFSAPVNVGKAVSFNIKIANITNGPSTSANATVSIINNSGGNDTGSYLITTTACPVIPGNNDCGTPTSLTPSAAGSGICTTTNGTTFGATASPQATCTGIADDDVWYSFLANSTTHQVTVSGVAGFNAVVQIMAGPCAVGMASIQCVNATGSGAVETANLTGLTIGTTYFIRVYHNGAGPGVSAVNSFTICITSTTSVCTIGAGNILGVSLPYNSSAQTTCGAGDDITSSNSTVCGSSLYYGGEDKVITFVPAVSGNVSINLTSAGSWVGMTVYLGCPTAGGTCVAYSQSSLGNQSIGCASVLSGQTYYLVIDSYPAPTCNAFSVTISAPSGGIPIGTTCSNAVAMTLPYSATAQSTLC